MNTEQVKPKFNTGTILATPGAEEALKNSENQWLVVALCSLLFVRFMQVKSFGLMT